MAFLQATLAPTVRCRLMTMGCLKSCKEQATLRVQSGRGCTSMSCPRSSMHGRRIFLYGLLYAQFPMPRRRVSLYGLPYEHFPMPGRHCLLWRLLYGHVSHTICAPMWPPFLN
eukprot:scaffold179686_cov19-Tisochrysis_lutea.AAC.4